MTPAARYQATIELVQHFLDIERPADALSSQYFRDRRYIGSSDRKAVHDRFYRILRHMHRLHWWHDKFGYTPTARSYVFADTVLNGEQDVERLSERICDGSKFAPKPLSDSEVNVLNSLQGQKLIADDMEPRVRLECPIWAWNAMLKAYGQPKAEQILAAMQVKNNLHIRVNTIKTNIEDVMPALEKMGLKLQKGLFSPWCIRIEGRPSLAQSSLLRDGYFEIQNEGSQLIALATDAKPGDRVVDFCAGAGGKTLAMAAMMNNKGSIIACDVLEGRLKRSKDRFKRAGVHNVETRPLSSERDTWVKRHKGKYDIVLVDAPCSGVGTWRGDPDKRWRELGPGLSALVPLQKDILQSASRLVKPGGRLVYATCSLLPEENEKQIEYFLQENTDFQACDLPDSVPESVRDGVYMKANPHDHDCDGFFAAVVERSAE